MTSVFSGPRARWFVAFIALFCVLWFGALTGRKLFNPDEGRYAEIPREMVATGDWVTPRLNDLKYFEKPPLQYWATAVAYNTLGESEFTARLWCGITGFAALCWVAWLGGRLFDRRVGLIAAALLAGSLMHVLLSHVNTLDVGLSFFLNVAVGAFLVAQGSAVGSASERNWMLLAWTTVSLAVLSKGVVAIALPGTTLVAYSLIKRKWAIWRRLHALPGLAIFLVIAAPWFIAVSIENPEFARFFFYQEHVQRFFTQMHRRVEPWWFFVPVLLAACMPWATLIVPALGKGLRDDTDYRSSLHSVETLPFLSLWIVVVVLFFSLSQSKLAPYILPAVPALAIVTARYACSLSARTLLWHVGGIVLLYALAMGYLSLVPAPIKRGISTDVVATLFAVGRFAIAMALFGALVGAYLIYSKRCVAALIALNIGSFICIATLLIGVDGVRELRSGYDLAIAVAPHISRDKPLYSLYQYDHSLTFYLRHPAVLVGYRGELDFGLQEEPDKGLADEASWIAAWIRTPEGSIALLPHDIYAHLVNERLPMDVIGRDIRVTAVQKPFASGGVSAFGSTK